MNNKHGVQWILAVLSGGLLASCAMAPSSPSAGAGSVALPSIPAPVPVRLDAKTTTLMVLDINSAICPPRPACMASVPAIESLLNRARAANVPVVYSTTGAPGKTAPMLPAVTPRPGEPVVTARANKFIDTNLEELLKQRNARTVVIVGSASNGAVLYSSFHANVKGFTVVVAEDGISALPAFDTFLTRYQLLNQPGFSNPGNQPLEAQRVTLSRTDLITFQ
jgi:nicotinamidase-related amidase